MIFGVILVAYAMTGTGTIVSIAEASATVTESVKTKSSIAAPLLISVTDELRRATNEYAYGNYNKAAKRLESLLYPMRLYSDEQVVETRKLLALCSYLLGNGDGVRSEFAKLLFLQPDFELDPFTIAPPILELLEEVRRKHRPELDVIRQRRHEKQRAKTLLPGYRRVITTRTVEMSQAATLLPFGIGQFQNQDYAWGAFFAATQSLFLAINIGAYLTAWRLGDYISEDAEIRQNLTLVQYSSAILFGVTWTLGVYQARLRFVPFIIRPPKIVDEPHEQGYSRLPSIQNRRPLYQSLNNLGLGLIWEW